MLKIEVLHTCGLTAVLRFKQREIGAQQEQ